MYNPVLLVVIGLTILASIVILGEAANFSVDDSFIYFRYVENVVAGHGFVFNPGEATGEGFTSWAWMGMLSAARLFGFDIILVSKILGFAFHLLTALLLYATIVKILGHEREGKIAAIISCCVYFPNYRFLAHSVSGMETSLYIFSFTLLAYMTVRAWHAQPSETKILWLFSLSTTFIFFVRPEGLIAAVISFGVLAVKHKKKIINKKTLVCMVVGILVPISVFLVWKKTYFGGLLPLAFYHKMIGEIDIYRAAIRHLSLFVRDYAGVIFLGFLVFVDTQYRQKRRIMLYFGILFVFMIMVYIPFIPAMNYLHRFYVPYLICIIVILSHGILRLVHFFSRYNRLPVQTFGLLCVYGILVLGMNINLPSTRTIVKNGKQMVDVEKYRGKLGKLMSHLPRSLVVANTEMGVIPYYSGLTCLDMAGLTDPVVARQGLTMRYLLDRKTELILFPREVETLPMDWFEKSFRDYDKVFLSDEFKQQFERLGSFIAWPDGRSKYFIYVKKDSDYIFEIRDWYERFTGGNS